ncbi:hypothetical protein NTD84_17235 [Pseudomonas sp. 14P_8.1_Bac3]|uniref:hypothetical protein n=1 Tax=Pseudomonas sp. 14P_8.1_Bac3 TaxID=2971621 RepID=UPI0021C81F95|nr:hypothetical protein [Pseudomonas sp. 14P_8.1_Bac3]MCU1761449.1 hypothetical protein [Pseudomonas sp. 14P_8.1_Bac3]
MLAKNVNDDAISLIRRGAFRFIASSLLQGSWWIGLTAFVSLALASGTFWGLSLQQFVLHEL